MVPGLQYLPIRLSNATPPARYVSLMKDAADMAAHLLAQTGAARLPALATSGGDIAWRFLEAATAHLEIDKPRFCEWGSGVGLVTCLAWMRGWHAVGVEIEPRLVDASRDLAERHEIAADFHLGSYNRDALLDPKNTKEDFETGLGFDLFDFDVIYAYPWPAERDAMTRTIARHAPNGTIFLRYGGGFHCDAFQVRRDA